MGEQTIDPGEIGMISTGVSVQFPRGVYMKISGRSSLNAKGILVIDGTVDADYFPREIKILILNARKDAYTVKRGERCAQGLFLPVFTGDDGDENRRRTGGFGSTNEQ